MNILDSYEEFIFKSRYARWLPDKKRRETWEEAVKRYCDFFADRFGAIYPYDKIYNSIVNKEVVPSMRALMCAGAALAKDEMALYNCSYVAIDHPRAFDEILYILTCGTGVGFSVERQYITCLPVVAEEFYETDTEINVADSRTGWASAFRELISLLYSGRLPKWDTSKVRPAGARLKTFGGRASGPEPLEELFRFTTDLFRKAAGRKLNSLECHDLVCKIADVVIVGGVRRSALISLSNLSDDRMRNAKNGAWWEDNVQRALANNSIAYTELPDVSSFLKEWHTLYESKSGERGVFNRVAATKKAAKNSRRKVENQEYGCNPCGEIILRSKGLCNLSEVVIRPEDTLRDLERKVEVATIIGTFQSAITNFRYVRSEWKKNAEEERLLGVSLTGIMDNELTNGKKGELYLVGALKQLKRHSDSINEFWAGKIGIAPSVAIQTIKPSGTVSQLMSCSSGIHPAFSEYYVRTVRMDNKDPLTQFMKDQGVPNEPDVTKPNSITVFSFPRQASKGGLFQKDIGAIGQLELYKIYQEHWTDHNVSNTVYYTDKEFIEVGSWVYRHFDIISGVSFLPKSDHVYKQAPYQEITKEEYDEMILKMPTINWEEFLEEDDDTTSTHTLSCVAGACEIVGSAE